MTRDFRLTTGKFSQTTFMFTVHLSGDTDHFGGSFYSVIKSGYV